VDGCKIRGRMIVPGMRSVFGWNSPFVSAVSRYSPRPNGRVHNRYGSPHRPRTV
jgi:hypothetical protein